MDLPTAKKRLNLRFRSAQKEFDRIVNSDSYDEGDLHIALGTIEEEIKKIAELKETIEVLLVDADVIDENQQKEIEENNEIARKVKRFQYEISVKQTKTENEKPKATSNIKLPPIDIPAFWGDRKEYHSFLQQFQTVNENTDLPKAAKFKYLLSLLKGEAKKLVSGFPLTDNNYPEALSLLDAEYGDQTEIQNDIIRSISNMKLENEHPKTLRNFCNETKRLMRQLHSLDFNTESAECQRIFAITTLDKLPANIETKLKNYSYLEYKNLTIDEVLKLIKRAADENTTTKQKNEEKSNHQGKAKESHKGYQRATAMSITVKKNECNLCRGEHRYWHCDLYDTQEKRIQRAHEVKLCTACFRKGHIKRDCKTTVCANCYIPGHKKEECRKSRETTTPMVSATTVNNTGGVALPLIKINLKHQGKMLQVNTILDTGSQRSFIRRHVVKGLGLEIKSRETTNFTGYGNTKGQIITHELVTIPTKDLFGEDFNVVIDDKNLPSGVTAKGLSQTAKILQRKGVDLANQHTSDYNKIELLIGSDYYSKIVTSTEEIDRIPIVRTPLGVVPFGRMMTPEDRSLENDPISSLLTLEDTEEDIKFLWSLDSIGITDNEHHPDDKEAIRKFENEIEYTNNKYIARLPWKRDPVNLPTNYMISKAMLKSSLEKLRRQPEKLKVYNQIITQQLSEDFIELVEDKDEVQTDNCHYLTHHAVHKDSPTTPLRIVFNCSFKGKTEYSLNDCLYKGPNLLPQMLQVLMRFRLDDFAVIADIKKAFLQVGLHEKDRDYTRFLWPEDPMDPDSKILVFRYKNILFGSTASQFLLNAVIQRHLENVKQDCSEQLIRNIYVDNIMNTGESKDSLKTFSSEATEIMATANLPLVAWASNENQIVDHIPTEKRDVRKIIPVLGLNWNVEKDTLSVSQTNFDSENVTKRKILSGLAAQFDPIGFYTPILLHGKLLMRDLHKDKYTWDKKVDEKAIQRWKAFTAECEKLPEIEIPRAQIKKGPVCIHAFSDASKQAYGAVIYAVQNDKTQFIVSKTKLAPQKELSIPKLELTALLLSSRLVNYCEETYSKEWDIKEVHLHSDSQVAIGWVTSNKTVPAYVENRRVEIRENVPHAYLHHIDGKNNPADLLSRGTTVSKLDSLWWNGPDVILQEVSQDVRIGDSIMEVTNNIVEKYDDGIINSILERCGSYNKVLRVISYIRRFGSPQNRKRGPLDAKELDEAEKTLIKGIQKSTMSTEINYLSKAKTNEATPELVKNLNLQLEDGILVVMTRLQNADMNERQKRPYFIPETGRMHGLLIRYCHKQNLHGGLNSTLAHVQQRYYMTRARQRVKSTLRECVICRKEHGNHYKYPLNSQLPKLRITPAKPFEVTGVDYAGPFITKNGQVNNKRYVAVYTCAVTRAVHLEIANNLSAPEFLSTFQRFVSRRGYPSVMISDNATNFLKSSQILTKAEAKVLKDDVTSSLKCVWHFIPARTPWYGGFYERIVGLMKSTLRKVVGKALLTDTELYTILCRIESCLNDRPLTYVTEGNENAVLTPSTMMTGHQLNNYPEVFPDVDEVMDPSIGDMDNLTRRQKYISSILGKFWERWSTEYLPSLRITQKNKGGTIVPKVGDIVLIDNEAKRLTWPLGRVSELIRGKDDKVRTVRVRTKLAVLERPVSKVYPLEVTSKIDNIEATGNTDKNVPLTERQVQPLRQAAIRAKQMIVDQLCAGGEDVEISQ